MGNATKVEHDVFEEEAVVKTDQMCYVFINRRRFVISSTDEDKVMGHIQAEFDKLKAAGWSVDNRNVTKLFSQVWMINGKNKCCLELRKVPFEK
jgi:hypothetical protein